MKSIFTSFLLFVLLSLPAFSQSDWSDDFNSGTIGSGWYGNSNYNLSQNDGMLKIACNKVAKWASFGVNIPASDFSANPVVNLSVKTGQPFLLTVYLFSAENNVLLTQDVMASGEFATVSFDFTGLDASNNVLNAVNGIGFAVNGAALSWFGTLYFDDLTVGSTAVKYANLGALPDMTFFQGTTGHKVFVRGITNAASLELTGADALLENISIDPVSTEGTRWLHFDCLDGVNASGFANLTAVASPGYTNNTVHFMLNVEGNKPPTLSDIPYLQASVGIEKIIELTGISDGNSAIEQTLVISASSDNATVIGNPISVLYDEGSRYAKLSFTPLNPGITSINVTLDDQSLSDNTFSKSVTVEVLETWNSPPTLDLIPNAEALNTAGEQTISLKGISDGDNGSQTLVITATSSDPSIIPDPVIIYTGGKTAELRYIPVTGISGKPTITVTVADNGGAAGNNGNQSIMRTFTVETYDAPLTGYVIPFTGETPNAYDTPQEGMLDYWHIEGMGVAQSVSYSKDGTEDVLQIDCQEKNTWTGAWYYTPEMDLTDFPLLSMWVKCDKKIQFHIYFWDDSTRNNEDHHLRYEVLANTWTKLNFDFSDPTGMLNGKGQQVNAKRIIRVLFNYHPNFNWPFTNWTGTVQFKDIRIGDESGITPTYDCTIDPVGQQSYYSGNLLQTIKLTGISRGKDKEAQVSVSSNGLLPGLNATAVSNGESLISFTPSLEGLDTITVTVSGAAIDGVTPYPAVISIPVSVINETFATAYLLTTNPAEMHQVYYGLGAKDPGSNLLDQYTLDFGASAVRFGILDDNQVEPVNDNEDPNVLDMNNLNYDAFDWNYVRDLKARGVETFLFTFWSPPAWMKENLSTNYQQPAALTWEQTSNKVLTDMYDEYAEDVLAVVKMFKQEADVDLAAIGIQNEPAFCEPYASAILSPEKFADMIVRVGKRFEAEGITTRLYAAEQVGGVMSEGPVYSHQSYLNAFDANAEVQKYSDIFAVHGYASDGIQPGDDPGSAGWAADFAAINAKGKTRELWMTETEPGFTNWSDAFNNSADILTAFESGNVNLWTEWAWDGHCIDQGQPTQKLWAQSMYSFIRPGAKRITSASGNNDILATTWVNDAEHGGTTVTVLMNKGLEPLSLSVNQEDMPQNYTVYRCSENVARFRDDNYLKGDKLLLGPKSMVTLVSGVEGEPTIDPVPDQLIFIDAVTVIINLSGITDGYDVNQNTVSVTYSLSDNTLITDVSLTYVSPASTGSFSFKPAKAGNTDVTISITANGVTTDEKFTVIVKDYSLPTIFPVTGELRFQRGLSDSIALAGITDGGDGGQMLTVSAEITSSNPAGVLLNPEVNYTSPTSTGTFKFLATDLGTAEVTITVTDNGPAGKNTTTTSFTVTVAILEGIADQMRKNVKLYPNPATDRIYVEFPENSFNRYSVFTTDGTMISSQLINGNKIEVNTSALLKGFYLFMLEGKEKSVVLNFVK